MPRRWRCDSERARDDGGGVLRLVVVVTGIVLGGVLGFVAGMVGADVVNALGSRDEADYIGVKVLGPLAAAVLRAVAGEWPAAAGRDNR